MLAIPSPACGCMKPAPHMPHDALDVASPSPSSTCWLRAMFQAAAARMHSWARQARSARWRGARPASAPSAPPDSRDSASCHPAHV
eukprot:CAMPEP_0181203874 /NCGR_PEP_ID=MMETSP1096-20121128/19628_1 /TAXON_ID=156174 ORGANISM="Chrysochromulina ericina, Strain CCMP281" /NCGR_SAMPLE_ID=MMETSP1096 /ASSEMBLY_ACC=CAM_ASM_000453 /LENGTH=85 /DNA_ID=CAMNT_0023294523 /DNA_START=305 /DNA_END=563 /DNA_ORIENTATION=-